MKFILFFVVCIGSLVFSMDALAGMNVTRNESSRPERYLFQKLKQRLAECVEASPEALAENGQVVGFRVKCADVKLLSASQMFIKYNDQSFALILHESSESDGGDLNDLYVYDSRSNIVATKYNVLAFNNVIVAILGLSHE